MPLFVRCPVVVFLHFFSFLFLFLYFFMGYSEGSVLLSAISYFSSFDVTGSLKEGEEQNLFFFISGALNPQKGSLAKLIPASR